ARRDGAHQRARVEHAVVVGEVVRRNEIESRVALRLPVRRPQLRAGLEQVGAGQLAAPIALGGALQLAVGAEWREAKVVGDGHRGWESSRDDRPGEWVKASAPGRPGSTRGGDRSEEHTSELQ